MTELLKLVIKVRISEYKQQQQPIVAVLDVIVLRAISKEISAFFIDEIDREGEFYCDDYSSLERMRNTQILCEIPSLQHKIPLLWNSRLLHRYSIDMTLPGRFEIFQRDILFLRALELDAKESQCMAFIRALKGYDEMSLIDDDGSYRQYSVGIASRKVALHSAIGSMGFNHPTGELLGHIHSILHPRSRERDLLSLMINGFGGGDGRDFSEWVTDMIRPGHILVFSHYAENPDYRQEILDILARRMATFFIVEGECVDSETMIKRYTTLSDYLSLCFKRVSSTQAYRTVMISSLMRYIITRKDFVSRSVVKNIIRGNLSSYGVDAALVQEYLDFLYTLPDDETKSVMGIKEVREMMITCEGDIGPDIHQLIIPLFEEEAGIDFHENMMLLHVYSVLLPNEKEVRFIPAESEDRFNELLTYFLHNMYLDVDNEFYMCHQCNATYLVCMERIMSAGRFITLSEENRNYMHELIQMMPVVEVVNLLPELDTEDDSDDLPALEDTGDSFFVDIPNTTYSFL